MGVDASPCYRVGDQKPNMPTLEELCRTGVVFENAWSNPECSPTRATILTGRHGFRTGVTAAVLKTGGTGIRLCPRAGGILGQWFGPGVRLGACAPHIADARQGALAAGQF